MKNDIIKLCHKYRIPLSKIKTDHNIEDIISIIENMLINRIVIVDDPRRLMSELWKIKNDINNKLLYQTPSFQSKIKEILKLECFFDDKDYLICKKLICCSVVQQYRTVVILNDDQKLKMSQLGYGITSYRIKKSENIREVYCEGLHPNLNQYTKQFCLDDEFLSLELSMHNIYLLEELLSQFNMTNCYIPYNQKILIEEIINA